MAHEIWESDNMFSVREVPWHGLGNILTDYPTIQEAIVASGLSWKVYLTEVLFEPHSDSPRLDALVGSDLRECNDRFVVVREDTQEGLGVVGPQYEPFQNDQMWDFIDTFCKATGSKLETAGSLKGGRRTWVLCKHDNIEYITGDPLEKYFLLMNAFDGTMRIANRFTDVRVVCNNTLNLALGKKAENIAWVKHTRNVKEGMVEAQKMLQYRIKYDEAMKPVMTMLANTRMSDLQALNFLETEIFPPVKMKKDADGIFKAIIDSPSKSKTALRQILENVDAEEEEELSNRSQKNRAENISLVIELIANGKGTDIPGVRNTAYGVFNGITEWSDHVRPYMRKVRGSDYEKAEGRFSQVILGSGNVFKQQAFEKTIKYALAA